MKTETEQQQQQHHFFNYVQSSTQHIEEVRQTPNLISFNTFCKRLEYRRTAVYFNGLHLFNKVNPEVNAQLEVKAYNWIKDNKINLLTKTI